MFRATSTKLLFARTAIVGLKKNVATAAAAASIHGANPRVAEVDCNPGGAAPHRCAIRTAKSAGSDASPVPAGQVITAMHKALAAACAAQGTDRGVLAAPSLGFDARIIVVHSGFYRIVLINPRVTIRSNQLIHRWDRDGESVVRVARHRSVAVKYTTVDGDDETWYNVPLEESEAIQAELDRFDGFSAGDRAAPVPAHELPTAGAVVAAAATAGLDHREVARHGVVPQALFDANESAFMRFVEDIPRSKLALATASA